MRFVSRLRALSGLMVSRSYAQFSISRLAFEYVIDGNGYGVS